MTPCCWKVRKKLEEGKSLDWASAEALAFGSLLLEGKKETRGREATGLGFSRGLGISSCECKKVVSDFLGETEFFADIRSAGKITHFSL